MPWIASNALVAWLLMGGGDVDPSARALFPDLLVKFGEGAVNYAYPDNLGNITTGRGNELAAFADFADLDWLNPDGSIASSTQLHTAWLVLMTAAAKVRADGPEKWPGGGHYESITSIRATQSSIDSLIQARLTQFDADLRAGWEGWDEAPPPAQEGLMRIAWACGTKGPKGANAQGWPKLHAAWVAKRWGTYEDGSGCADQCAIPALDGTEPTANETERALFIAASQIGSDGMGTGDTVPAPPDDT